MNAPLVCAYGTEGGKLTGPKILIACVDTDLRNGCFDGAGAIGLRADAVGDQKGLKKRLSKDSYDLVILQGDLQADDLGEAKLLELEEGADISNIGERIKSLIEVPEFDPESVEDLPPASPLPWKKNMPTKKKAKTKDEHSGD